MGRRSISRGFRALALVLVLALVAAACGGDDDDAGGGGNNGGPPTTKGLVGADDPNLTPTPGGTVTYGLEADTAGGFCLYKAQLAIGGIQVARAIYDTLTAPGADGEIHPLLAESVTSSKNNRLWTIKLRPDIKFHDGSALTAQVVKENLDHYRRDNPLFIFVFPDVESVDVVDELTLTVSMKRPWTAFPWFLWSSSRLGIMAKAQMDSPDCNTKLIGTGPFRCQGNCWRFGDRTTLVKNPNYWQKDAQGRQLPYLDGITFVPQEDGPKRLSSLQANDFQAMHTSQPKQITPLRRDVQDGKLRAVESDRYAEIGYVMLNNCKTAGQNGCGQASPFQYKSAREAFAYAIDRDTVNRIRNDNILTRATGPFSSEVMGYLPDTQLPQYDEAKARDAVARYKQESGQSELRFTLNHTSDPETTATATLLQQMLSRVGIRAALNAVPDQSTLINIAIGRRYDATLWRNHPGADSDTQYVWWHCNNAPPANCDNIVNFGGFNDPVINKAFDDARVATDPAVRRQHYETINRQFAKELYNLWAEWTLWVVGLKPNVHGVLGPKLPDGTDAFPGLATGHPVSAMWCEGGSC